jgi:hypothetical protein
MYRMQQVNFVRLASMDLSYVGHCPLFDWGVSYKCDVLVVVCILSSLYHFTDFVCSSFLDINGGSADCNINLCTSPMDCGISV